MKCHQGLVNAAHMFLDLKVTSKNASKKRHAFSNEVNYSTLHHKLYTPIQKSLHRT